MFVRLQIYLLFLYSTAVPNHFRNVLFGTYVFCPGSWVLVCFKPFTTPQTPI